MTTQDLFSKIQVAINDPTFTKIQRAEYLQYLQETLGQIALHSGLYLYTTTIKANEGDKSFMITLLNREPMKIEHVTRGGYVCREFSDNAMRNAEVSEDQRGFATNNTIIGDRAYSVRLSHIEGTIELFFPVSFYDQEELVVTLSTTLDSDELPTEFADPKFIPLYAFDAIYHGVLSKIMQSLMIRDSREYNNSWQMAEQLYDRKKKDLLAYIRKLKSRAGVEQIQPLLWLSDNGIDHRTGGPGIPPEYTTNYIEWD